MRTSVLIRLTTVAAFSAAMAVPIVSTASSAAIVHTKCDVSLSPTATETLFAIGAGPSVAAVDLDSNYPKTGLPSTRIDAFNPSAEAIATICPRKASHPSSKPDLVVVAYDANSIVENLSALGVHVVVQNAPVSLSGVYDQILQLGSLTGHSATAKIIVGRMKTKISLDVVRVKNGRHGHHAVSAYYELDTTLYSLTSATFVGQLMHSLGMANIADAVAQPSDYGYPQLGREYVVSASPKVVLLADTLCCSVTAKNFGQRPGFSSINAVVHSHIALLDDDVASRWGPRLPDLMHALTKVVLAAYADPKVWK